MDEEANKPRAGGVEQDNPGHGPIIKMVQNKIDGNIPCKLLYYYNLIVITATECDHLLQMAHVKVGHANAAWTLLHLKQ